MGLFRGFADPTRLRLLNLLAVGELCVCDLVEILSLPQPLVSRHLTYLRRAGLVDVRRVGRFAYHRLATPRGPVHEGLLALLGRDVGAASPMAEERRTAAARRRARVADPCRAE